MGATEDLVRPERAAFFPPSRLLPVLCFSVVTSATPLLKPLSPSHLPALICDACRISSSSSGRRSNWRWRRPFRSVPSWVKPFKHLYVPCYTMQYIPCASRSARIWVPISRNRKRPHRWTRSLYHFAEPCVLFVRSVERLRKSIMDSSSNVKCSMVVYS